MKETVVVFSDHIGRIVAGKLISEDDATLKINNPVIIHVEPQPQTGQLQVHTFPYVFMEFIKQENRETSAWTFNKSQIVVSDVELDDRLLNSVLNINNAAAQPAAPAGAPQGDAKVVNLFDEE